MQTAVLERNHRLKIMLGQYDNASELGANGYLGMQTAVLERNHRLKIMLGQYDNALWIVDCRLSIVDCNL